jgi:ribosome-associated protein
LRSEVQNVLVFLKQFIIKEKLLTTKVRAGKKKTQSGYTLRDIIIESIQDKKGEEIVALDLQKVHDAVCDHFIICHATASVQVRTIAHHIIDNVEEKSGEKPYHKEGFENMEWVLIDYVDVVVHVFLKPRREFYQLEDLWSDATKVHIK